MMHCYCRIDYNNYTISPQPKLSTRIIEGVIITLTASELPTICVPHLSGHSRLRNAFLEMLYPQNDSIDGLYIFVMTIITPLFIAIRNTGVAPIA